MWRSVTLAAVLGCGSSSKPAPTTPVETTEPTAPATPVTKPSEPVVEGPAAPVQASGNRCDVLATNDISVDGLLDDWQGARVVTRIGSPEDGVIAMRCAWDGNAIAFAFDMKDDRVVRVKGGSEDRLVLTLSAGDKPVSVTVWPGNSMAKSKITKTGKVEAADSLQPKGFSVEVLIPATAIAGFSPSTPSFSLNATFHDSDAATGGDTTPLVIEQPIELGDRKDLLDDFLSTARLRKADIKLDQLVELDPDRKGKERIVAGGTVIGILTDQFAYVSLPAASPGDVKKIELLPLGAKPGQQVVSALVRQTGNGGSRDLLMLWTVWSGQLQPLVNIEVRKEMAGNVLESSYRIAKGKRNIPELLVEAKPAVGFTPDNFAEVPAGDSDSIVLPWDDTKAGIAYSLTGAETTRRDLPKPKKKR